MTEQVFAINTLTFDVDKCIGCGMCVVVCPHGVFAQTGRVVEVARPEACIECGACERNCVTQAISVESGPGCAEALIRAALFGGEPTCGPSGCCGSESAGDASASCCGGEGHKDEDGACCGEHGCGCSGSEVGNQGESASKDCSCGGGAKDKADDACCGGKCC